MIRFYPLVVNRDWPFVSSKLPIRLCEDTKGIIGVSEGGDIVAACVFDSWTHNAVQAHIWIGNPIAIKRGFLSEVADYVFNKSGREIMLGLVPGDNLKALSFDKHIGFEELCVLKDGFAKGVDYHILEMRKCGCRWLEGTDGKESARRA